MDSLVIIKYRRIPFGLINAGDTFQRAMDIDFHGLIGCSVVASLDDVTIFSKNTEERAFHLNRFSSVAGNMVFH